MYCRRDCLDDAKQYFHEMPTRDLVTWNTVITGLDLHNPHEALKFFLEMNLVAVNPNYFTFTSVVSACGKIAALRCGEQVHGTVICRGFSDNLVLCNSLIDMYSRCGNIIEAQKVFNEMLSKDVVSWTTMMTAYGKNGYGNQAVQLFEDMVAAGFQPDYVVFLGLISACSHAGLVEEGWEYFKLMTTVYGVKPTKEVYGCVADLLGRVGRLQEAFQLIESMPFEADEAIWGSLLGSCKVHKNIELGRLAAARLAHLQPGEAKNLILLSNLQAAEGEWVDFAATRKSLKVMGSRKEAGASCIEVNDKVYTFVVADSSVFEGLENDGMMELLLQHDDHESSNAPDEDWLDEAV